MSLLRCTVRLGIGALYVKSVSSALLSVNVLEGCALYCVIYFTVSGIINIVSVVCHVRSIGWIFSIHVRRPKAERIYRSNAIKLDFKHYVIRFAGWNDVNTVSHNSVRVKEAHFVVLNGFSISIVIRILCISSNIAVKRIRYWAILVEREIFRFQTICQKVFTKSREFLYPDLDCIVNYRRLFDLSTRNDYLEEYHFLLRIIRSRYVITNCDCNILSLNVAHSYIVNVAVFTVSYVKRFIGVLLSENVLEGCAVYRSIRLAVSGVVNIVAIIKHPFKAPAVNTPKAQSVYRCSGGQFNYEHSVIRLAIFDRIRAVRHFAVSIKVAHRILNVFMTFSLSISFNIAINCAPSGLVAFRFFEAYVFVDSCF